MRAAIMALCMVGAAGAPATPPKRSQARFEVVLRPETGADGQVDGITIIERIDLGRTRRSLSVFAPLSLAGLVPIAPLVAGLMVSDARGEVGVTTSDVMRADDEQVRRWTTVRPVAGLVVMRYRMPLQPIGKGGPPYGVKAAGRGLAGNSSTLLILPEGMASSTSSLGWDLSQLPAGSIGITTGGVGSVMIDGPPEKLLDRWLLAGPAQAGQAAKLAPFSAYTLGKPPFDAAAMMGWSRKAYAVLAKGFGYLGTPRYELLLRALEGQSFITGTASEAGGGSLITTGSVYLPDQNENTAKGIIFHEMGHQWVGQFDGGGSLWFAEGLNVYITSTLLCEKGLEPWAFCAEQISKWAEDYYASEGRTWPQARIEATPFGREDIRRVPYGRGMLYFANLDAKLRARSGGKDGLLTILRPLFDARRAGRPITPTVWERFLRDKVGADAVLEFRRFIIEGQFIIPAEQAFGPHLQRVSVEFPVPGGVRDGYAWKAR